MLDQRPWRYWVVFYFTAVLKIACFCTITLFAIGHIHRNMKKEMCWQKTTWICEHDAGCWLLKFAQSHHYICELCVDVSVINEAIGLVALKLNICLMAFVVCFVNYIFMFSLNPFAILWLYMLPVLSLYSLELVVYVYVVWIITWCCLYIVIIILLLCPLHCYISAGSVLLPLN